APVTQQAKTSAAPARLRLLVVDDPAMAEAIGQLRAELQARTGGALEVSQLPLEELLRAESPPEGADAIIYPSPQLGPLVQNQWLAPLPTDFKENRELAWSDTFELEQTAETAWGPTSYAVPFGSPVLVCFYRADLFEKLHKRPPQSWSEYQELAKF